MKRKMFTRPLFLAIILFVVISNIQADEEWSGLINFSQSQSIDHVILNENVTIQVPVGQVVLVYGGISGPPVSNSSPITYNTSPFSITIKGGGTLQLTGDNKYTGTTTIEDGCLHVGNGTSGHIDYTSGVVLTNPESIIRFEPAAEMMFSKVISGQGQVYYRGKNNSRLFLTAENTYTGITTIENGILSIGSNTPSGHIAGNIEINSGGTLEFRRSDNYTFPGDISGAGQVEKYNVVVTTLTGVSTYTGSTLVMGGVLQIGDGSSGSMTGTSNVDLQSNTVLRFEPGEEIIFNSVITGDGNAEYRGSDIKQLIITGNNTFTGTTTIENGVLSIGSGGYLSGNIHISEAGYLVFASNSDYSCSGVISGNGNVIKRGKDRTTLLSESTFAGTLFVEDGILSLGETGTIETAIVNISDFGKLDISAGNKTIKELNAYNTDATVLLGSNRLTLESGDYAGQFSGTGGGVNKTGTGIFTMNHSGNTATGVFNFSGGTVRLSGNWAGSFYQSAGTSLDVNGNFTISGGLTLYGGIINMDLSGADPSMITVNGPVSTSGVTQLNITATALTNHTLIQAALGLDSTAPFLLNVPGFPSATLTANGTQLILYTGTGNSNPLQSTPLKAWIQDGTLHVNGLSSGVVFSVYNLTGAPLYKTISTIPKIEIPLPERGLYVVRAGVNTLLIRY